MNAYPHFPLIQKLQHYCQAILGTNSDRADFQECYQVYYLEYLPRRHLSTGFSFSSLCSDLGVYKGWAQMQFRFHSIARLFVCFIVFWSESLNLKLSWEWLDDYFHYKENFCICLVLISLKHLPSLIPLIWCLSRLYFDVGSYKKVSDQTNLRPAFIQCWLYCLTSLSEFKKHLVSSIICFAVYSLTHLTFAIHLLSCTFHFDIFSWFSKSCFDPIFLVLENRHSPAQQECKEYFLKGLKIWKVFLDFHFQ